MEDTIYKIETIDKNEMGLMLNATKLAGALYDIINWYSKIYNCKDYGYKILYDGKLYDLSQIEKLNLSNDEWKETQDIYLREDLERILFQLTDDVRDIIYSYYD